ncbi:pyrimidine (deoxy)nucleoside triphosphate pyrophosphohydrolase [Roseisolibacter agri]|uniref:Pyrimidine (Deoxy)nucleoside triphosphate pyrophosphohydrolase n=1 Tax=Roseisolibacter agri TaxID=2014610 RepID=A0AA37V0M0_9BACT|nr:pyrimidine (deoxy)nucleoside triphosphate pyrophosphohydrolase [Roseisolibacter agri]
MASVGTAAHIARVPTDTIRVIAAVIANGDRLLVCQRPPHKRHGGLWEFPGGKCEPGESDADAADRELREELGISVVSTGAELAAFHDPGSPFLIAFVPVEIEGEPVCHEHMALFWGTPEELAVLPLAPTDRRFVGVLLGEQAEAQGA